MKSSGTSGYLPQRDKVTCAGQNAPEIKGAFRNAGGRRIPAKKKHPHLRMLQNIFGK